MIDREKVIKALGRCKDNQYVNDCNECDYGGKTGMFCIRMIDDVLVVLKEHEAIEPDVDSEGTCTCGNCGENVGWYPAGSKEPVRLGKYCPECGRAVKCE